MKNKLLISLSLLILLTACQTTSWVITEATSTQIAIDSTLDTTADKEYIAYITPLKNKIDREMDVVIGFASETMTAHGPESLLSNFSADVYLQTAVHYLNASVDIAIVNLGGLRSSVPQGEITVRKVFELMPFENELVILWLKGDKLNDLLNYFASIGGQGVAGLRMTIDNNCATNILIGDEPLQREKLYTIATNDYLAGGNDKMSQLAENEKHVFTSIKIRDMLLNYIREESAKGNNIQSTLDGRITIRE